VWCLKSKAEFQAQLFLCLCWHPYKKFGPEEDRSLNLPKCKLPKAVIFEGASRAFLQIKGPQGSGKEKRQTSWQIIDVMDDGNYDEGI